MAWSKRSPHPDMNLNDLDYSISYQICQNFDVDRGWEQLAGVIGYSTHQMKVFELEVNRPDGSPTKKLLWDWGTRGGTVRDLYHKLGIINKTHIMRMLEHIMTPNKECSKGKEEKIGGETTPADTKKTVDELPSMASSSSNNAESLYDRQVNLSYDPTSLPLPPPPRKKRDKTQGPTKPEDVNLNVSCKLGKDLDKHFDDKALEIKDVLKGEQQKYFPAGDQGAAGSVQVNECQAAGPASGKGNLDGAAGSPSLERVKSMLDQYQAGLTREDRDVAVAMIGTLNFTYKELSQATGGFCDERKLGQGTFGMVYQGVVTNTKCAIKRLFQKREQNNEENQYSHLSAELKALSRFRHENIVALYGYALDGDELCVVYQFMPNGSLEDCLHGRSGKQVQLSWQQRLVIASGAACGLQFLHNVDTKPLIHGDIKSANILLDRHFEAKIGDLGLAQHATGGTVTGQFTHITKKMKGSKTYQTRAYLAPEIQRGNAFSMKGDTYAFGVVLFEILTGLLPYDEKREGSDAAFLVGYIQQEMDGNPKLNLKTTFQDTRAPGCCLTPVFDGVFHLAVKCTEDKKKDRPSMTEVYKRLEELETDYSRQSTDEGELERKMSGMAVREESQKVSTQIPEPEPVPYENLGAVRFRPTGPPSDFPQLQKIHLNKPKINFSSQTSNTSVSPIDCFPKDQPLPDAFRIQVKFDKKKDPVYANIQDMSKDQSCPVRSPDSTPQVGSTSCGSGENRVPMADPRKMQEIQQFDQENMGEVKLDNYTDVSPCYANLPQTPELYPSDPRKLADIETGHPVPVLDYSRLGGELVRKEGSYVSPTGTEPQEGEDASGDDRESVSESVDNESILDNTMVEPVQSDKSDKSAKSEMMQLFADYEQLKQGVMDEDSDTGAGEELDDYTFDFDLVVPEEDSDTLTEASAQQGEEHVYVNVPVLSEGKSAEEKLRCHQAQLAKYQEMTQALNPEQTGSRDGGECAAGQVQENRSPVRQSHTDSYHGNSPGKEPSESDCYV